MVLEGNRPNLIGRNWLKHIRLDWTNMNRPAKPTLDYNVLITYGDLLKNELGKLNGATAKIYVEPLKKPIF